MVGIRFFGNGIAVRHTKGGAHVRAEEIRLRSVEPDGLHRSEGRASRGLHEVSAGIKGRGDFNDLGTVRRIGFVIMEKEDASRLPGFLMDPGGGMEHIEGCCAARAVIAGPAPAGTGCRRPCRACRPYVLLPPP